MKKVFLVMASAIMLCSCIKESGTPGPRGPAGRDGRDGKDGVQITVRYFNIEPSLLDWKTAGNFGQAGYYCYAEAQFKELTADVIDKGAVLAYMIDGEYDNQLPYLIPYNGYTRVVRYDLRPGTVGFIVEDADFKTQAPPFMGTVTFKVVVIQ